MDKDIKISDSQRLEKVEFLTAENSELLKELRTEMTSVKRYMRIRLIMGIVWLVIIILPAILAFLYLPSYIKNYLDPILDFYNKF